jgi:hypothetical protein
MRKLMFLHLYLLSQSERSALSISLDRPRTLIVAGNQMGKSAIMKSLYEVFGAQPHKIDDSWKRANVATLLKISIDDDKFSILKNRSSISIFDINENRILETSNSSIFFKFLADLLDFRLVISDQNNNEATPPSAYLFAPYYIDQDKSWNVTWSSFVGLGSSDTKRLLAEYHLGLKSNAYFQARAKKESLKLRIRNLENHRKTLHQALQTIKDTLNQSSITFGFNIFKEEMHGLTKEANDLARKQDKFRQKTMALHEQRRLWARAVQFSL